MRRSQVLLFAGILLLCVGCDYAAKQIAGHTLSGHPTLSLAGDTLRLELVHNSGAFLSLGSQLPAAVRAVVFVFLVPVLLTVVCGLAMRAGFSSSGSLVGLGLIAGGGLGNWLDRLLHAGTVTDYVSLGVGPLRTGIFNLADVCVMVGVGVLLLEHYRESRPRARAGSSPDELPE